MNLRDRDNSSIIYAIFLVFSGALVAASLLYAAFYDGFDALFSGMASITRESAFLGMDAYTTGSPSAAYMNAGIIGFSLYGIFKLSKLRATGYTIVSYFLVVGLAFSALSIFAIIFIVPGVWLFAFARQQPFSHYANNAVLAVALEPALSLVILSSLPIYVSVPLSLIAGFALGFVFQPVFTRTQIMHRGHTLYNTGIAAGFIGAIVCGLLRATTDILPDATKLSEMLKLTLPTGEMSSMFIFFFGTALIVCLFFGLYLSDFKLEPYIRLLGHSGHGLDFTISDGLGSVLINMSVMGFLTICYFYIAKIPLTGLAACALLGVVGLSGDGAHPRNSVPVVIGYAAMSLLSKTSLVSPIYILSLPFAVALAPISGRFGAIFGVIAGAFHALLVPYSSTLSGGLNLCAGGFASGIVAVVMTSVLESMRSGMFDKDRAHEVIHAAPHEADAAHESSLAAEHSNSHTDKSLLMIRNILALAAGALFVLSLVIRDGTAASLRAVAYIVGALAYGAEILVLTDMFRKKQSLHEMLMPYLFGLLYIVLGLSYIVAH